MIRIKEESHKDKNIEEDVPNGPSALSVPSHVAIVAHLCPVPSVRRLPFVSRLLLYLLKKAEKKKSEMKKR